MPTPDRDVLVLFSGGMDSRLCAEIALRAGRLTGIMVFDYGQPAHAFELAAARSFAAKYEHLLTCHAIQIRLGTVQAMEVGVGETGPRVVPGRNAAFVSVAACHRVALGFREIWIGAIRDDAAEYEDCRSEFVTAMNDVLRMGPFPVRLVAPLIEHSKEDVVRGLLERNILLHSTWNCYQPTDDSDQCGRCNSCVSARNATMAVLHERGQV